MRITIKLFAVLRGYFKQEKDGAGTLDVPEGATVKEVLTCLGLPEKTPKIVQINGEQKSLDDPLAEGDILSVFPPMAGG